MVTPQTIAKTCIATKARQASRNVTRIYDDALRPFSLKIGQFSILIAISVTSGTATITELAGELGMERTTLSRNLKPLERRGLIALGQETQYRSRSVELTQKGKSTIAEASAVWASVQKEVVASLTESFERTDRVLKSIASI